jgi:hypothetical protein
MPLGKQKSIFMACCGKTVCWGCLYAHKNMMSSVQHDKVMASRCLFCRTPSSDKKEYEKRKTERVEANDPAALREMGTEYHEEGDYDAAFGY